MDNGVETRFVEMVFPNQVNHYGTLFGGHALHLMDMAAFVAASRHTRKTVVTVATERVEFRAPVHQGQLLDVSATVVSEGQTSVTVEVLLHSEDLLSGDRFLCTQGRFVLVAVDKKGRPVPFGSGKRGAEERP